jgi:hypothetical protein
MVLSDVIMEGVAASRPAFSIPGRLYFATDTEALYYDTGSAWINVTPSGGLTNPMTTAGDVIVGGAAGAPARLAVGSSGQVLTVVSGAPAWAAAGGGGGGGGFSPFPASLTAPLSANFTWDNQGSSTVADKTGRMVVQVPAASSQLRALIYNTALPSYPYTIDAAIGFSGDSGDDYIMAGIILESSSGTFLHFTPNACGGNPTKISIWQWASTASVSNEQNDPAVFNPSVFFVRITDDGTTRSYYLSNNGLDYGLVNSEASGAFLTPVSAGLGFYNGSNPKPVVATIYNWLVSDSILPQISA